MICLPGNGKCYHVRPSHWDRRMRCQHTNLKCRFVPRAQLSPTCVTCNVRHLNTTCWRTGFITRTPGPVMSILYTRLYHHAQRLVFGNYLCDGHQTFPCNCCRVWAIRRHSGSCYWNSNLQLNYPNWLRTRNCTIFTGKRRFWETWSFRCDGRCLVEVCLLM